MRSKKSMKEKGITLIALIVTIIILLILAGVTISLVVGEQGIIGKTKNATSKYAQRQAEEQVALLMQEYTIDNAEKGTKLEDFLKEKKEDGTITDYKVNNDGTAEITKDGYNVKVSDNRVTGSTKVADSNNNESGNSEKILSEDELTEKIKNKSGDSAIDEYGNEVNLKLWNYEIISDSTANLGVEISPCYFEKGYLGEFTNGKIQGNVPTLIKDDNKIYKVTKMNGAFFRCTNLTSVDIPKDVTSLCYTFDGCTNLTSVNIPEGATDLECTFGRCTSLTSVNIPDGVNDLPGTFTGCTSLTSANVPEGVNSILNNTFGRLYKPKKCKSSKKYKGNVVCF